MSRAVVRFECLTFSVLSAIVCAATIAQDSASPAPEKLLSIVRTEVPPVIDGRLDEPMWQSAAVITDLHQVRPGNGTPSSERTEVYLLYDKDALYVGARMWDSEAPGAINATIMKQGSGLRDDDRIAILVDPFNSGRSGYRFEVNANGVRNDMLYTSATQFQLDWSVVWDAAGSIDDEGWVAEFAIPFKSLPFDPSVQTWGLNVSRAIRRKGEESAWVSRNRTWNPGVVGAMTGMSGLDQGRGLDIVPGFSATRQKVFVPSSSNWKADPSLDVYYRITPSLSGSLTFNTDFSGTEVDARQVNLTRFGLFFPEKRNFFLNDADLFEFGRIGDAGFPQNIVSLTAAGRQNARPFFSRRLGLSALGTPVDIEYGGKLSGRLGRWNIGALAVRQDEYALPNGTVIEPTNAFVTRLSANVLDESTVGIVATSGDPTSNRDNSLVGADFLYMNSRLPGGRSLAADAWFQQSDTEGLEGDDAAFGLGLRVPNAEGVRGGLNYREVERNFYPGLGFVNRTGVRDYVGELGYTRVMRNHRFLQFLFTGLDVHRAEVLDSDDLQTQVVALRPLEVETRARDTLKFVYLANDERLARPFTIYQTLTRSVVVPTGRYSFDQYGFDLVTGTQRKYSGELKYRTGDFYEGERTNVGGSFVWRQSKHFALTLRYDWNDIELPQGDFITRLMGVTSDVAFSSTLTWTTLLQYDDVSEVFGLHSRLHWIPRAGQEMFLVANRSLQDFDKDNSFQSVNSEFAARVGYTFRF